MLQLFIKKMLIQFQNTLHETPNDLYIYIYIHYWLIHNLRLIKIYKVYSLFLASKLFINCVKSFTRFHNLLYIYMRYSTVLFCTFGNTTLVGINLQKKLFCYICDTIIHVIGLAPENYKAVSLPIKLISKSLLGPGIQNWWIHN